MTRRKLHARLKTLTVLCVVAIVASTAAISVTLCFPFTDLIAYRGIVTPHIVIIDDSENSVAVLDSSLRSDGTIRVRGADGQWQVARLVSVGPSLAK